MNKLVPLGRQFHAETNIHEAKLVDHSGTYKLTDMSSGSVLLPGHTSR